MSAGNSASDSAALPREAASAGQGIIALSRDTAPGRRYLASDVHIGARVCVLACICYDGDRHQGATGTVGKEAYVFTRYFGDNGAEITVVDIRLDTWYRVPCLATLVAATEVPAPKPIRRTKAKGERTFGA